MQCMLNFRQIQISLLHLHYASMVTNLLLVKCNSSHPPQTVHTCHHLQSLKKRRKKTTLRIPLLILLCLTQTVVYTIAVKSLYASCDFALSATL